MRKSTKAALLSGLVFPGLGHLYLKRWVAGILIAGVAACATWFIVSVTVDIASDIARKIESGAVAPDVNTINSVMSQQLAGSEQAVNIATIVLAVCWVAGVVGSLWQGRSLDEPEAGGQRDQ